MARKAVTKPCELRTVIELSQMRRSYNQQSIRELAESIEHEGQLHDGAVNVIGVDNEFVQLGLVPRSLFLRDSGRLGIPVEEVRLPLRIYGHRRDRAHRFLIRRYQRRLKRSNLSVAERRELERKLQASLTPSTKHYFDLDVDEFQAKQAAENFGAEKPDPQDCAFFVAELWTTGRRKHGKGYTLRDLARRVSLSPGTVRRYIDYVEYLPPEIHQRVGRGELHFSIAAQFASYNRRLEELDHRLTERELQGVFDSLELGIPLRQVTAGLARHVGWLEKGQIGIFSEFDQDHPDAFLGVRAGKGFSLSAREKLIEGHLSVRLIAAREVLYRHVKQLARGDRELESIYTKGRILDEWRKNAGVIALLTDQLEPLLSEDELALVRLELERFELVARAVQDRETGLAPVIPIHLEEVAEVHDDQLALAAD